MCVGKANKLCARLMAAYIDRCTYVGTVPQLGRAVALSRRDGPLYIGARTQLLLLCSPQSPTALWCALLRLNGVRAADTEQVPKVQK